MPDVSEGDLVPIREGRTMQPTIKRLFNGCLMVALILMWLEGFPLAEEFLRSQGFALAHGRLHASEI